MEVVAKLGRSRFSSTIHAKKSLQETDCVGGTFFEVPVFGSSATASMRRPSVPSARTPHRCKAGGGRAMRAVVARTMHWGRAWRDGGGPTTHWCGDAGHRGVAPALARWRRQPHVGGSVTLVAGWPWWRRRDDAKNRTLVVAPRWWRRTLCAAKSSLTKCGKFHRNSPGQIARGSAVLAAASLAVKLRPA